ncbi:MAG TPA: single-stranded DNA-binding protein [Dehalococcoidia bacterium]|nr:single-stranded DNA-binding protein [Dehalococcoidia bacterium]
MSALNKVLLIGNVGTDPEMRFTPNGNPVTSFRLAVGRTYNTQEGERRQETDWFSIVTWGKQAESCNQYLTKGKRIFVEGRFVTSTWEGQDGQKRTRYEVNASRVIFLDKQTTGPVPSEDTAVELSEEITPEDLPFNS